MTVRSGWARISSRGTMRSVLMIRRFEARAISTQKPVRPPTWALPWISARWTWIRPTSRISAGSRQTGWPVNGSRAALADEYLNGSVPTIGRTGADEHAGCQHALPRDPQVLAPLPDDLGHQRHRAAHGAVQLGPDVVAVMQEAGDRFRLRHALVDQGLGFAPIELAQAVEVRGLEHRSHPGFEDLHACLLWREVDAPGRAQLAGSEGGLLPGDAAGGW